MCLFSNQSFLQKDAFNYFVVFSYLLLWMLKSLSLHFPFFEYSFLSSIIIYLSFLKIYSGRAFQICPLINFSQVQ